MDLIKVYKYLKGGNKEDNDRLFSVVPGGRTRIKGHTVEHRKFYLQQNTFLVRVVKHWNRLTTKVMKPPSLKIFKT